MKQRLTEIINELRDVCKIEELSITDEVLFREACTFIRGEIANSSRKDFNKNQFTAKSFSSTNLAPSPQAKFFKHDKPTYNHKSVDTSSLATPNQIDFLAKQNLDLNFETLTKAEAFSLISEIKSKGTNKNE